MTSHRREVLKGKVFDLLWKTTGKTRTISPGFFFFLIIILVHLSLGNKVVLYCIIIIFIIIIEERTGDIGETIATRLKKEMQYL